RGARRPDADAHAGASPRSVGALPPDRALHHSRRGGSAPPRRHGLRDDRAPRPRQAADRRRASPPAHHRGDDLGNVQPAHARGPRADPGGAPQGPPRGGRRGRLTASPPRATALSPSGASRSGSRPGAPLTGPPEEGQPRDVSRCPASPLTAPV